MGKGKAEGCAACAKWLLIIFNVLFCLLGIGLIAAGVYSFVQLRDYLDFFGNENLNAPGIVLIVFGVITFIIAAIGCIGACKESSCLLFTFAGIIVILLIVELVCGIVAFVYRGQLQDGVEKRAKTLMGEYNETATENEGVQATWDLVQNKLKCCGIVNASDWKDPVLAPKQGGNIPKSCGKDPEKRSGCVQAAIDFGKENIGYVGAIGIAFAVIQIFGIILACCVGCAARKGEYA